jgi:tripartite-type tricarboxylate transporter receptor subunit TctC
MTTLLGTLFKMKRALLLRAVRLTAALVCSFSVSLAFAAPPPIGKLVIAINSAPGGGYDTYARLVAAHLGRFLPGSPMIVPTNMPGGGGLIAANWLYNAAPRDGSAIGIIASSAIFAPFLGTSQAKYDPGKFNWLASLDDYHGVGVVTRDSPVKTAADLLKTEITVGAAGQGSDITIWPQLLQTVIGAKLRLVRGYDGAPAVYLAMTRHEVQSIFGVSWSNFKAEKAQWLADGEVRPIVQLSLTRSSDLQNVPTILDLTSDQQKRATLNLFIARQTYARPFLAPPGVPPETIDEFRGAFEKMVRDPAFLKDANRSHLEINVSSGVEMKRVIDGVLASPRPIVDAAIKELNGPE